MDQRIRQLSEELVACSIRDQHERKTLVQQLKDTEDIADLQRKHVIELRGATSLSTAGQARMAQSERDTLKQTHELEIKRLMGRIVGLETETIYTRCGAAFAIALDKSCLELGDIVSTWTRDESL